MVGCTRLMCFVLGASTRKEVKTLTRIIRLSIRLGEWPAIAIVHSEPRQPQSSVSCSLNMLSPSSKLSGCVFAFRVEKLL